MTVSDKDISVQYSLVEVKTGEWSLISEQDNYKVAVPKFLNNLSQRLEVVMSEVAKAIELSMSVMIGVRKNHAPFLLKSLEKANSELTYHSVSCRHFNSCFSHLGVNITEIETYAKSLDKVLDQLKEIENCWKRMLKLYKIDDPHKLVASMHYINMELNSFYLDTKMRGIFEAFFYRDDASRGLVRAKLTSRVWVHSDNAWGVYIDCIIRLVLKKVFKFPNSEESKIVDMAFSRIDEMQEVATPDPRIEVLRQALDLIKEENLEDQKEYTFL